jgi:hypothetical protein
VGCEASLGFLDPNAIQAGIGAIETLQEFVDQRETLVRREFQGLVDQ